MSLFRSWLQPNRHPDASVVSSRGSSPLRSHQHHGIASPSQAPLADVRDHLHSLERKAAELHGHLQSLLDAQAEGLAAGLDNGQDTQTSNASTTSDIDGLSRSRTIPVRQPPAERVSLRAARRGIRITMRELATIKREEARLLDLDLQERRGTIARAAEWETKRQGLQQEVASIHESQAGSRLQNLKQEGQLLQEQITAMETQLLEFKSRQRAVSHELSTLENSIQSRLSSYHASLELLDSQISDFLISTPGLEKNDPRQTTYLSLPSGRRTLEMALDHTRQAEEATSICLEETDVERKALEEGIEVWEEVVDRVSDFERFLASCIRKLDPTAVNVENGQEHDSTANTDSLQDLSSRIDHVVHHLEMKLKLAESRGWNLLLCCISAELEALTQGRQMLDGLSNAATREPAFVPETGHLYPVHNDDAATCHEPSNSKLQDSRRPQSPREALGLYDDEPDPDMLVSQHDTD